MSDKVFGCFSCIAFIVIVLFNVGLFTPSWITKEEISVTNSTTTPPVSTTTRICHHGLLYSIDCTNSKKGNSHFLIFFPLSFLKHSTLSVICKTCMHPLCNLINRIHSVELFYRYEHPQLFSIGIKPHSLVLS